MTSVEHGIKKLVLAKVVIKVLPYAKESVLSPVQMSDIMITITTIMKMLELEIILMMIIVLNMDI